MSNIFRRVRTASLGNSLGKPCSLFWLVVLVGACRTNGNHGAAASVNSVGKITNFTIGAVLSDDRHDTLFREAITVMRNCDILR